MKRPALNPGAGRLRCRQIQIHDNRILSAAHDDGFADLVGPRIDLLVRYVRRHIDEIARSRFIAEFQAVAPAHARAAADNVENRFEFSVMMRSRLRVRLDDDCSRPQFCGARTRVRSRGCRPAR